MEPLRNYRALLEKVDTLCRTIGTDWREHISCRKGCDECCRNLEIFAVEAASIAEAAGRAPEETRSLLRSRAENPLRKECPLLHGGECLLYEARPLICRTHGLPLLLQEGGARRADFCPRNFRGVASLPGSAFIDLDRLNGMLAAVNLLFLKECGDDRPERVPMTEALKAL